MWGGGRSCSWGLRGCDPPMAGALARGAAQAGVLAGAQSRQWRGRHSAKGRGWVWYAGEHRNREGAGVEMRLWWQRKKPVKADGAPATVHFTSNGAAYVDPAELLRSKEFQRLLDRLDEVFEKKRIIRPSRW